MTKAQLVDSPYINDGRDYGKDILFTDQNGQQFTLFLGGNGDLYFVPDHTKTDGSGKLVYYNYILGKEDSYTYGQFENFLKTAKKADKYNENFDGEKFFWLSEDAPEDIANRLEIQKYDDAILLDIIVNKASWTHGIRFTLSGSRNFNIAKALVDMRRDMQQQLATEDEQQLEQ